MKNILLLIICSTILWTACNERPKDSKEVAEEVNEKKLDSVDMEDDGEFAVKAADGGMMEVSLAEMAKNAASSPHVKDFASMMVKDHEKANEELKMLAAQQNITLPVALSDGRQKKVDDFSKLKGDEFDKKYMSLMIDDHKEDIDDFSKQAKDGKDSVLISWASKMIPVLQQHLRQAEKIDSMLKNK